MKKRYIFMIAICAILSILVSCDGSVDEMLFVHKVTFDYGNGEPTVVKEVKHGEKVDEPEDNPTKSGYVFKCWSLDGTNPFDFDNTAITKNITIKAVWGNLSKAGDIITLGEKDGVRITWKALSVDTEKKRALIVCEDVLATKAFSNSNDTTESGYTESNDYEKSTIRTYLNDKFISDYGLPKDNILKVDVTTTIETTKISVSGEDYVFLLSQTEAENTDYFANDEARVAKLNGNSSGWWLRTPNGSGKAVCYVDDSGDVVIGDGVNDCTSLKGIRPAFWYTWDKPTYNVGDTGPAGGIIFYVNPNAKEDGWRYLEAAPTALKEGNTYKEYTWGAEGADYNTEDGVGKGKTNTDTLMSKVTETIKFPAAEACDDYSVNEDDIVYDDWFLPSIGELRKMYDAKDKLDSDSVEKQAFWSSTGYGGSGNYAWEKNIKLGNEYGQKRNGDDGKFYVWPVRRF